MADNNVDSILIPREQAIMADEKIPSGNPVEIPEEPPVINQEVKESEPETPVVDEKPIELTESIEPTKSETPESPIDEYGNPIEKPKMYSEEEVQSMIRDRLKRGHRQEEPTNREVNQAAKDFKADPESEESWEVQLGQFIDKKLEEREKKVIEKNWQREESARQAEFESKFTTGMNKYKDFQQVVAGKPITGTMMLATRALENPAAFIYGASKMHPQELDRIARIADPYTQAAEVGRLHERMVKERNTLSKSPKPIEPTKGDMPNKSTINQPSLEDRIHSYAKTKRR